MTSWGILADVTTHTTVVWIVVVDGTSQPANHTATVYIDSISELDRCRKMTVLSFRHINFF